MNLSLKIGYLIQEIAGEKILIADADNTINFSRMLVLNDSAAELVQIMIDGITTEEGLVDVLIGQYMVELEEARKDVRELLMELKRQGVLTEI